MTVKDLIDHLLQMNQDSEVLISCEGGCVIDSEVKIVQSEGKVTLEIE